MNDLEEDTAAAVCRDLLSAPCSGIQGRWNIQMHRTLWLCHLGSLLAATTRWTLICFLGHGSRALSNSSQGLQHDSFSLFAPSAEQIDQWEDRMQMAYLSYNLPNQVAYLLIHLINMYGFLSNLGPAGWLLQRRVVRRRRAASPSTRWWPENTPSTFTGASTEWVSRNVTLGHSEKSGNLQWRRRELQMYALTPGSTKPSGPKK